MKILLSKELCNINATNRKKWTPLHSAALKGNVEAIKLMLEYGAVPDKKEKLNFTPLHLAVRSGVLEAVKILLEKGAKVNMGAKGRRLSRTPLRMATSEEMQKLLLEYGATKKVVASKPIYRTPMTPYKRKAKGQRQRKHVISDPKEAARDQFSRKCRNR